MVYSLEGGLVGGNHARAGAGLDRHIADRHARLHRHGAQRVSAELDHVAVASCGANHADNVQDHVLGRHARPKLAAHLVPATGHTVSRARPESSRRGGNTATVKGSQTGVCVAVLTSMRMFLARFCSRVWVARTCSTSLVPIPKARAPKAPCVAVWLRAGQRESGWASDGRRAIEGWGRCALLSR